MKKCSRILEILQVWMDNYPCLTVTLLWRIELYYLQKLDLDSSNRIIQLRAKAYKLIVEKYSEDDSKGIEIFNKAYMECSHLYREMLSPEKLALQEQKAKQSAERRRQFYDNDDEFRRTTQFEDFQYHCCDAVQQYILDNLPGEKSLFDKTYANRKFNGQEERNILDILELLSYDEEKQALYAETTSFYIIDDRHSIGYHEDSLKFRGIIDYQGKQHLCPFRTSFGLFYRGQSSYYSPCFASFDRALSDEEKDKERKKANIIETLLKTHSCTKVFEEGLLQELPSGKKKKNSLSIDYYALAQHYGVKTNLLDLTTDKMIAAFFACTGYNWKEDKYFPFTKKGKGVFYVYRDDNIFSKNSKISCVGLQPLSRPGAQAGFVINMNPCEDFNNLCSEAIFFTHNKAIAKQIFELVNLLCEPFTNDLMSKKAKEISKTDAIYDLKVSYTDEEKSVMERETQEIINQLHTMVYYKTISLLSLPSDHSDSKQ